MVDVTGVFEGGGVRAIALAGAAGAAMEAGLGFASAVGTSGGALVAATVMAGMSPADMRVAIGQIAWPQILERRIAGRFLGGVVNHLSILRRQGVDSGDRLERTVASLLGPVSSFGDLPPGALRLVTTDIRHGRGVTLPDDLRMYGYDPAGFPISRAVRMSSAVPFVFEPVSLEMPGFPRGLFADGAFAARFPTQIANGDRMMGFRIVPRGRHPHHEVRGPLSLAAAVMSAGMSAREHLPSSCPDLDATITVAVERSPLDFDMSRDEALALFDDGYQQAYDQLSLLSDLEAIPRVSDLGG